MNATFLQDNTGNYSLSRLIVFISVCVALLLSIIILILSRDDVLKAAEAIAIVFGTIAVPCFTFLFKQKEIESKIEINAQNTTDNIETK